MKKNFFAFTLVCCIFVLTGCGSSKNTLTCTYKEKSIEMNETIIAELDKNDVITNVSLSINFDNESEATAMCKLLSPSKAKCNGKTIFFSNYSDYLTATGDDDLNDFVGMTKANFKTEVEGQGITCK